MRSCRHGTLLRAAILVLALLGSGPPARAERLESPLELMFAPDAVIVAGPLLEVNPTGRVVIARKDVLWGKERPPEKIDARVRRDALADLSVGQPYVMAYSIYLRDPRRPVAMVANPKGATVLDSPGIEPALFRDTPALRAILKAGRSERGRESRRLVGLLMSALAGHDAKLQNLAAGELAYEPELGERLRDADRAAIEKVASDPRTPIRVRTVLLGGSSREPERLGDWWKRVGLQIVTTTPVDGYADAASDPVNLVLTAFEVLDRYAVTVPLQSLKRWVWSPDPPLVEKACLMLRREAPGEERSTIQLALADPKLPEATRKFLNGHLRRLDRMEERAKTRKEGSG
jgi:hypothetical protein